MSQTTTASPPAAAAAVPVERLSFEDALAELEGIVKTLEKGDAPLEVAISAYTRGTALRAHCERKLAEAEERVQAIVLPEGGGGAPSLRDVG